MTRFVTVATLAFTLCALGSALDTAHAQQPAADKQAVPAAAEPAPAEAPPAGQPAQMDVEDKTMIEPVAQPVPVPVPVVRPPSVVDGKVTAAAKAEFMKTLEADEAWRNEFKQNLFDRIVKDPKSTFDFSLRAQMADTLRPEIHKDDASRMLRNRKHVVYAYAALWVLTALFVLFMFRKQRSLNEEIARLRGELEEAIK